ncbi:hypothetical protein MINS_00490 [Mycolicibacterium insubricum]|nr:hypothetical protein [Mycolicibacterium insubricum]MCB9438966.1 hypothetical protein [Mycolicibacterium sp.]BBZ64620.1 hypothetical protein MINS_00490 [Mycolicibacterium insubricum]
MSNPNSMTVLLVPRGESSEIISVLADYSAVELVDPFVWVDPADIGRTSIPATFVHGGRSHADVLQRILTEQRYQRVRVAVLVPADAPADWRAPRAAEQALEQAVRAAVVGTPITLLRILYTRGIPEPRGYDPAMVLEGWHNLLIAPEDSAGPTLGSVVVERLADPLDVATLVSPVVAAAAGLYSGIGRSVFDELPILPGHTVRAVRAYYRQLDALGVEDQLRIQLFDAGGRLPLPRSSAGNVVYVQDTGLAAQTAARALMTKHREVLRGSRMQVGATDVQAISSAEALKAFMSFLGAALRNAPAAWLSGMLGSVQSVLASTVQHAVFGGTDSAYSVVANAQVASWQELGRGADAMSSELGAQPGAGQLVQTDLSGLWNDYVNGALTLADGGRRSAAMEPIAVGAGIGVLPRAADVVPSAADAFTDIPASLAAVVGIPALAGGDVLGTAELRGRLESNFSDPAAGVEARHTFEALHQWDGTVGRSYAAQVGSIMADFMGRARAEVSTLVEQIRVAAARPDVDAQLRERQRIISLIISTAGWTVLVALIVLFCGLIFHWGHTWWTGEFVAWVGGSIVVIYFIAALILFIVGQRHLFAELSLRKSRLGELEAMQFNLRSAVQDLSRLSAAYGQLLAWNRVLGEVLRMPFGPVAPPRPRRPHILDGLPRSTQVGVAAPVETEAEATAHNLQRRLYGVGWLTGPWEQMLATAARQVREDPAALFRMGGVGSGSGLDGWSHAVATHQVQSEGATALWGRVQAMFDDPASGIAEALTAGVFVPTTGRQVSPAEFSAGLLDKRRASVPVPFDAALFTPAAATAGRGAVAVDEGDVARSGLEYRAVVVQVGEGLPSYEFAMFAQAVESHEFEPTTAIRALGTDGEDTPPSESMVF